tara:strand:- start:1172 stop:1555 length:384 start_codon:yes stop_codon:yes gene_type:complete
MKVKISKTIDMEQIPGEARRMLDQAKNDLMYGLPDQMSQVVRSSLSSNGQEFFSTIEMLDAFRRNLAVFDENLQEIQSVLTGYRDAVMPPVEKETAEEEPDPEWLEREEAEYERMMAQADEVSNEEG